MKTYRLLFIVWCLPWICAGQSTKTRELDKLIPELADLYQIRFSFVDDVIANKTVQIPDYQQLTFPELIPDLERSTELKFEVVNDAYVIIRPFSENDLISVCGYLQDRKGNPLIGVTVSQSDGGGTFTDAQGFFQLDSVAYGSLLRFSYIGFRHEQRKVDESNMFECLVIQLGESIAVLREIVVNDYLAAGIIKREKAIEIYPQQLKSLTGLIEPDILQSIQQSPGVNSPFETAAGLYVRGGSPDQNLVLWNGIKTYNQGHFFGMISAFNPYITEKVSFVKNGTSSEYGDRVSSVVNIKSNESVAEKLSGGLGFNMLYGDVFADVPIVKDRLSLQFSARRSFTDLFENFTYNQMADRVFQNTKITGTSTGTEQGENQFYFNDFTTNVRWQLNTKNKLALNALYNKNDLEFSSSDVLSSQTFTDLLFNANEGLNLSWARSSPDESFSFNMDGNYAKYLLKYEFVSRAADTSEIASKKNLVRDIGYRFNSSYRIDSKHTINGGYHYSNNRIQYAYETATPLYQLTLDSDNSTVNTHSLYTEYQFNNEDFLIQTGLRVNHYSELDVTFFEPRLFSEKRLSKFFKLNTSAEYRTQVASQIKESVVSDLSLENKVWALASKDRFPVIKSYQATVGSNFKKRGWYVDLEGYIKRIDDVTTLTFGFLNPIDNEFRRGDSDIFGADLFVKKQFSNYESWLSYSYIRTENQFRGLNNNEPFPGNWNIEHTIKSSHILDVENWEFSLGWIWHTGKSFTDVAQTPTAGGPVAIEFSALNGNNLPIYHRLDFSVMYDFEGKNSKLRYRAGLSVLNLYNRRNTLNREFRTTPSLENELIDTSVFSLGITPNVVFRIFW